jgi:ABC-type bacteriocin/lantibiotic exporter with double-glycine peptidase domain
MRLLALAAVVGLVSTPACVSYSTYVGTARPFAPAQLEQEPGWIAVRTVPLIRQESKVDCGAAAISMVVSFWTSEPSAQLLAALRPVRPPGLEAGRIRDFARQHRLRAYLLSGTVADLEHELAAGRPIVVGLYKPQRKGSLTHYEVVVGLNRQTGTVVTLDPAEGWRQNNLANFLEEWKHSSNLALVVVGHG